MVVLLAAFERKKNAPQHRPALVVPPNPSSKMPRQEVVVCDTGHSLTLRGKCTVDAFPRMYWTMHSTGFVRTSNTYIHSQSRPVGIHVLDSRPCMADCKRGRLPSDRRLGKFSQRWCVHDSIALKKPSAEPSTDTEQSHRCWTVRSRARRSRGRDRHREGRLRCHRSGSCGRAWRGTFKLCAGASDIVD